MNTVTLYFFVNFGGTLLAITTGFIIPLSVFLNPPVHTVNSLLVFSVALAYTFVLMTGKQIPPTRSQGFGMEARPDLPNLGVQLKAI